MDKKQLLFIATICIALPIPTPLASKPRKFRDKRREEESKKPPASQAKILAGLVVGLGTSIAILYFQRGPRKDVNGIANELSSTPGYIEEDKRKKAKRKGIPLDDKKRKKRSIGKARKLFTDDEERKKKGLEWHKEKMYLHDKEEGETRKKSSCWQEKKKGSSRKLRTPFSDDQERKKERGAGSA